MSVENLTVIHKLFCDLTGLSMTYAISERRWYQWLQYFSEEDLKIVIDFIKHENAKHPDWQYSMRFGRLIGDLENFDDLLASAKAVARNRRPAPTSKDQVLQQWNPSLGEPPVDDKVIPIKEALRRAVNEL